MAKKRTKLSFDIENAREMTEAFAASGTVGCTLRDSRGETVHSCGPEGSNCDFCRRFAAETGLDFGCESLHHYAAAQSERFGGRYIYFCPLGMAFTASPILMEGKLSGSLSAGPCLIVDIEDFLEGEVFTENRIATAALASLSRELEKLPRVEPKRLGYLSRQLFADTLYISDSSQEILSRKAENSQQALIGDYISGLKELDSGHSYPFDLEQQLVSAVSRGEKEAANDLLNRILGYIFFYMSEPEDSRLRVEELFVVLGRAAISGGADSEQIFRISRRHLQELRALRTQEEFTRYLARSLNRFMELVFGMVEVKHSNVMHSALTYIGANFSRSLSLGEVAEHVGYSAAYFSRIFREEMGLTFKEYLSELRIEKSKSLLLAGPVSVAEVCHLVGFNDQSYFCKIFRDTVGVSPDKFRKRTRRIDTAREYGEK